MALDWDTVRYLTYNDDLTDAVKLISYLGIGVADFRIEEVLGSGLTSYIDEHKEKGFTFVDKFMITLVLSFFKRFDGQKNDLANTNQVEAIKQLVSILKSLEPRLSFSYHLKDSPELLEISSLKFKLALNQMIVYLDVFVTDPTKAQVYGESCINMLFEAYEIPQRFGLKYHSLEQLPDHVKKLLIFLATKPVLATSQELIEFLKVDAKNQLEALSQRISHYNNDLEGLGVKIVSSGKGMSRRNLRGYSLEFQDPYIRNRILGLMEN